MTSVDGSNPENKTQEAAPAKAGACDHAKNFLVTTQTPRWHTYLAALVSVFAAYTLSYVTDAKKRGDDYRTQQIKSLTDSMTQFQVYVAAFAFQASESKAISQDSKSKIIENLNDQYARLGLVEKELAIADKPVAENYRTAILAMRAAIESTTDVVQMGKFWTSASKLLVARNRLNEALRRSV